MSTKKVLFFANTDWHFYAHLMPIALEAQERGYEAILATNISNFEEKIAAQGIRIVPIRIRRSTINPFGELALLSKIIRILREEKPHILHNFTMKPILYGSIGGALCNVPKIINNFLGMGLLFMSRNIFIKLIKYIVVKKILLVNKYRVMTFVVQNSDDKKLLTDLKITKSTNIISQCSVGIESEKFPLLDEVREP
ncbi:MAG: glycosyltransferase, partial [Janthinobacterium lividum]